VAGGVASPNGCHDGGDTEVGGGGVVFGRGGAGGAGGAAHSLPSAMG
jgi:hypothetical protein